MRKIVLLKLVLIVTAFSPLNAQTFLVPQTITAAPSDITSTSAKSGCYYTIKGYITTTFSIVASGFVYSTSSDPNTMVYSILNTPKNCVLDNTKMSGTYMKIENLLPGTTYYYRAFICGGQKRYGYPIDYGDILSFTTLPNNGKPLVNNTLSAAFNTVCGNSDQSPPTMPLLTGSKPSGGVDGNFTYIWESSTDNSSYQIITNANEINYTPPPPADLTKQSKVWYRRTVKSNAYYDPSISDPVLISYYPYVTQNLTPINISREPNQSTLMLKANTSAAKGNYSVQWQSSTAYNGPFTTIASTTGSLYGDDASEIITSDTWYKAILLYEGSQCPGDESTVVSVTQADGSNNKYIYVKINNQDWMAENLFTEKMNDGTDLVLVDGTTNTWQGTTLAGYTWYNYDKDTYKFKFGALYNYVAVSDNVCPTGWSIPTQTDFTNLGTFVSPSQSLANAGKELKKNSPLNWSSASNLGKDKFGFQAIPGGSIDASGNFNNINNLCRLWTKTYSGSVHYIGCIDNTASSFVISGFTKTPGRSIRCTKK